MIASLHDRTSTHSSIQWQTVRQCFDLDFNFIHLSLAMLTAHPKPVQQAIEKHRKGLDSNPTLYYRNKIELEQHVLNRASTYLNTNPSQIAITESTTMGLAVIYHGLHLQEGDEILTTPYEHYAALETLRFREKKDRIRVKKVALYQDSKKVTVDEILHNLLTAITNKTRLVALTWVYSCTGIKLPVAQIAEALSQINANRTESEKILLALDAVHGFGVEDFEIQQLGCDFFIAGCHKWLFGPRGTGLIWGKESAWQRINPLIVSFKWEAFWPWFNYQNPDDSCPRALLCSPGGFHAFEHHWALGEAFDFHLQIGKKSIADRIHAFSSYCKEEMEKMPHLYLYTPPSEVLSSGMICFDVKGMDPAVVVEKLLESHIITGQTPYQKSCCRITPSILNEWSELEYAMSVLKTLVN